MDIFGEVPWWVLIVALAVLVFLVFLALGILGVVVWLVARRKPDDRDRN
jgi:hypothetical protein